MTKNNKKILIVEDDEDFVFILEKKFTNAGFTIVTAHNGEEGIAAVEEARPDLVLSDVLMPKMDGIEMAKAIEQKHPGTPIIFLTNIKDVDKTQEMQSSKEFDYLIKADTKIDDIITKVKQKLGIK